jgi:flagellar motor protein MotB
VSTPASRLAAAPALLSSPATSPLRLQQVAVPFVSPGSSRRNLTPLMNSMSPKPLPRTPRQSGQQQQQQQHQYNHRRTMSMSSSHQKTAVIAPSTYTGYDLSGRAYGDG